MLLFVLFMVLSFLVLHGDLLIIVLYNRYQRPKTTIWRLVMLLAAVPVIGTTILLLLKLVPEYALPNIYITQGLLLFGLATLYSLAGRYILPLDRRQTRVLFAWLVTGKAAVMVVFTLLNLCCVPEGGVNFTTG